jgi:5-methylcytosine-specific restriction endonuclease McrA
MRSTATQKKGGQMSIQWFEVFRRDKFRCRYCGFDGRTFEGFKFLVCDHFKPRRLGGDDELRNLVTACMACNFYKGGRYYRTIREARKDIQQMWSQYQKTWTRDWKHFANAAN